MRLATLVVLALSTATAYADAPTCPAAAMRVVAKGEWLAIAGGARCFAPDKDGTLDPDVLGPGLSALQAALPAGCNTSIEIAGDSNVSYQTLIAAMDLAVKAGMPDVGLTDVPGLSIKIDDSDALEKNARRCAAPAPAPAPPSQGAALPAAVVADAPIVVVSLTSVTADGTKVGDVAALEKGKGAIPALVKALKAHKGGDKHALILQADHHSSAALVSRVIASAKQAGYDNVLFAVKNKP